MDIRTRACFALSRRLMKPPSTRTASSNSYSEWRLDSLSKSWSAFSDAHVRGKDVLDFGCGNGELSRYLKEKSPASITAVDLDISRAQGDGIRFLQGSVDGIPVPPGSFDTIVAFDCMEHVMQPEAIMKDWRRVLRPGGRVLIEWFPYKGPWGPHMESLIPIPWAHYLFGQNAMFRTAERIYDLPNFSPRVWDLDAQGKKKPNKWRQWSSFREQGYINELTIPQFMQMAREASFDVDRLERRSFTGSRLRRDVGQALMSLPGIGEHFVSYVVTELKAR